MADFDRHFRTRLPLPASHSRRFSGHNPDGGFPGSEFDSSLSNHEQTRSQVMETKYLKFLGIAAFSMLSVCAVAAESGQSSNTPVTQLHFGPTGVTDGVHGELNAARPMAILRTVRTAPSSRCRRASSARSIPTLKTIGVL